MTDFLPAILLLDENDQPVTGFAPQGNVHIPITTTAQFFQLTPTHNTICKVRLRFATYCRINHCHITFELQTHCLLQFSARYLKDNAYLELTLPFPQTCTPHTPVIITICSPDATPDNQVALWGSPALPPFINTLSFQPMHFATNASPPRVSIIIPAFNKALYTYNCLLTLQRYDTVLSKEIILINNASTDETTMLLAQLQGAVKIINNTQNLGFVEACRQGAMQAAGEFILFLNNDTQVTEQWLMAMVEVMDIDSNVGITGSKLVYPDGRLQEAGGIIFSDASGWNYGRLLDPTDPAFDQSRVVDYCSGASLMIRKTLWEQVGGFDQRFSPAYYEDTDLCFMVRQAGYKVMYCHGSVVVHHEGITAGTDINAGYKAFQTINHTKFKEKWQAVLAKNHFPPGTNSTKAANRLVT